LRGFARLKAAHELPPAAAGGNFVFSADRPTPKMLILRQKVASLIAGPQGAGAQQLLAALLRRERLEIGDFGEGTEAATGPDIAQMIRAGYGDWGALPLAQLLLARVTSSGTSICSCASAMRSG
jgi:hypothetical protein